LLLWAHAHCSHAASPHAMAPFCRKNLGAGSPKSFNCFTALQLPLDMAINKDGENRKVLSSGVTLNGKSHWQWHSRRPPHWHQYFCPEKLTES